MLEKDGTDVDDDDVLRTALNNDDILILLGEGEEWQPAEGIFIA